MKSCHICKTNLFPGEGCDVHGGIYCDPDADRKCPRCGATLPPVEKPDFDWTLSPYTDIKECKKCRRSSKELGLQRQLIELDRAIAKAQKRIDELSQLESTDDCL